MKRQPPKQPGKRLIWRTWTTIRGRKVHASQFGLRAFPIWVDE